MTPMPGRQRILRALGAPSPRGTGAGDLDDSRTLSFCFEITV
jgi:hypothetical protein